jgi:hypothetical protein
MSERRVLARSARRARVLCGVLSVCGGLLGCAQLEGFDIGSIWPASGPLSERTVADGLRQALEIGTERASARLSAAGGFGRDPRLRLGLPDVLDRPASTLRAMGLGAPIDAFEDTMNRAAERAAGEAVPVFARAIAALTLEDAFAILNGPDDAATEYFRRHTSDALRARFTPVDDSMRAVGLYERYREWMDRYAALPIARPDAPDLAGYVTERTLDGLFTVLAAEEKAIREDPASRTTALLRRVFGASPSG